MAIQTIEQGQGLSGLLGQSLGTGLSAGLQGLAEAKMQQLQRQHAQKQLEPIFGSQVSALLQSLPPEVQKSAFQNIGSLLQLKEQLGGGAAQQEQPFSPHNLSSEQKDQIRAHLATVKDLPVEQRAKAEQLLGPVQQQAFGQSIAPSKTGNLIEDIFTSPHEKREQRKLEIEEEKLAHKKSSEELRRESEAFKETKEERREIIAKKNSAKERLEDLNRMQELEQEGKLDTPGYVEFLKRTGLEIPALLNPGSEEFNKIANNFIRDAKEYYGGRVTNLEMEQFLQTIPQLSQSPEGRKRVISNLKRLSNMAVATYDAYQELRSENKGIPPLDLIEKVDERMEKKRGAIVKKFKDDLAKPVPAGQNKMITGLQTVLGSVIGAPGKLLGKASGAIGRLLG